MNEKYTKFTQAEKIDFLWEAVANMTLYLMHKDPEYENTIKTCIEKLHKDIISESSDRIAVKIMKKMTEMANE